MWWNSSLKWHRDANKETSWFSSIQDMEHIKKIKMEMKAMDKTKLFASGPKTDKMKIWLMIRLQKWLMKICTSEFLVYSWSMPAIQGLSWI